MPLLAPDSGFPYLFLAKQPYELKFTKDQYLGASGGYAMVTVKVDVTNLPSSGQAINFEWGTGSAAFTISTNPFSSTNINTYTAGPLVLYCEGIAAAFVLNPTLSKDFVTTFQVFDGTYCYITITARQRGSVYNLSITNTSTLGFHNVTVSDDTVYANEQMNFYLDFISNICYEPVFTRFDDLIAVADSDPDGDVATYTFYELPALAQGLLDVDTDIPWAAFFLSCSHFCMVGMNFFSSNAESDDPAPLWQFSYAYKYITFGLNAGYLDPAIGNNGVWNFLTRMPSDVFITEDQPLFLTSILTSFLQNYTLQVIVTFDDASTSTTNYSQILPIQNVIQNQNALMGTWPAGYRQLGLDLANPGKKPVNMSVQLLYWTGSHNASYSAPQIFYFDPRFSLYNRYFLFLNSEGGYDTLRVRGINEYETKYQRTTAEMVRTTETTPDRGTIQMTYVKEERIWTMRTGWLLGLDELQWLRELLMTTYAAEILLDEGLYTPPAEGQQWKTPLRSIIILQDSVKQYKEDDGMWALEWKMKYADDRYVAGNDTDALVAYTDAEIEINLSASSLSSGCEIAIAADNNAQVYYNGELGYLDSGYWYFYFPNGEQNVNIKVVGYNVTSFAMFTVSVVAHISVTKISSPTLKSFWIDALDFSTINCAYLLKRLPYMPLTSVILDASAYSGADINLLLQMMVANYDTFGQLTYLELYGPTPSADGYNASSFLIGQGVTVNTY